MHCLFLLHLLAIKESQVGLCNICRWLNWEPLETSGTPLDSSSMATSSSSLALLQSISSGGLQRCVLRPCPIHSNGSLRASLVTQSLANPATCMVCGSIFRGSRGNSPQTGLPSHWSSTFSLSSRLKSGSNNLDTCSKAIPTAKWSFGLRDPAEPKLEHSRRMLHDEHFASIRVIVPVILTGSSFPHAESGPYQFNCSGYASTRQLFPDPFPGHASGSTVSQFLIRATACRSWVTLP